jgi:hypothetical protein
MSEKFLHIYPLSDLKEHLVDGSGICDCLPRYEQEGETTIVVHNSWDGREFFEEHLPKNRISL